MSLTLPEFIAARLDEDEAGARLAAREGGTWRQEDPDRYPGSIVSLGGQVVYDEGAPDENQAPHIARHDPARALRDVVAKRAVLAEHRTTASLAWPSAPELGTHYWCSTCDVPGDQYAYNWCPTLRAIGAVWSDHADYNPKWALESATAR